jgi:hypothetical protein
VSKYFKKYAGNLNMREYIGPVQQAIPSYAIQIHTGHDTSCCPMAKFTANAQKRCKTNMVINIQAFFDVSGVDWE